MKPTTWSVSRAQTANRCTFQYGMRYNSPKKGTRKQGNSGRIGSAVHVVLEQRLKGLPEREALTAACIDSRLTSSEVYTVMESRQGVTNFLARFKRWRAKHNVTDADVWYERSVHLHNDEPVATYREATWTGKIDVLARIPGDVITYVVIDHKTGKRRPSDAYAFQLKSYVHAVFVAFPDAQRVKPMIHWVNESDQTKSLDWCGTYTREDHAESISAWYHEQYALAAQRAEAPPLPSQGDHCSYCDYRSVCPMMQISRPR